MAMDRFTLFGLALALLGWLVLIADVAIGPLLLQPGGMAAVAALRSDVFSVAETAIFSGFAVAIIGQLRVGFGALHRFFGAVLDRASAPRPAAAAAVKLEPVAADPVVEVPAVELEPIRAAEARAPETRTLRGRNYVVLPSGAVEVDTMLGTRVFASLDEARDFIR